MIIKFEQVTTICPQVEEGVLESLSDRANTPCRMDSVVPSFSLVFILIFSNIKRIFSKKIPHLVVRDASLQHLPVLHFLPRLVFSHY